MTWLWLLSHWRQMLAGAALAAALGTIAYYRHETHQARRRAAQAALRADSATAAADTTRLVSARAIAVLTQLQGQALQAVERRAIQEEQRADQLDRALGRERLLRVQTTAEINQLQARMSSLVRDSGDVRIAEWRHQDRGYFRIDSARAELPPAGHEGILKLAITLDSIPLELRPGCGPPDPHGIRPATLTVIGPEWVRLRIGQSSQSPHLCRSPALLEDRSGSGLKWFTVGAVTGVASVVAILLLF